MHVPLALLLPLALLCGAALPVLGAAEQPNPPATMTVTSPQWQEGKPIPNVCAFNGMGLHGENRSPALAWGKVPAGTKSFAVTVFDPDAPTGIGWWHWVCFNIPGSATGLPAGAGAADQKLGPWTNGLTDYGQPGYGGPCPPPGDPPHHYLLTVYALDLDHLDLGATTTPALLKFMIRGHVLGQGTLTSTFQR